jgi:hypothetical protein
MESHERTVICMDAMKKMTDRELTWIIKYGTSKLYDRLHHLNNRLEIRQQINEMEATE